jgi:putative abortive phage resistance protein
MARQSRSKVKQLKNLLIVDGETEEVYFKNILQRYNMSAKDVKRVAPSGGQAVSSGMSEAHSFETAMRKQYSNYYIIIDRDNISRAEFEHIQREANQRQNVELIFSNIAFEVWLLAHYQNMTARPVDADADNARYRRVLSNYLDAPYKKGDSVQLDKIISSAEHPIDTAFSNTSTIQELDYDYQCTNVGPFLRQLVANR